MQRRHCFQFGLYWAALLAAPPLAARPRGPDWPSALQQLARQIVRDSGQPRRPFAIVEKRMALLVVHSANGAPLGLSRVLLGRTPGDHSVPGVGLRTEQGRLHEDDCTTPAGRFESEPGSNHSGEAVVWLDYAAALAIHRLRPGPSMADRARRLASPLAHDKRVSAGCVVVPAAFYEAVVQPALGRGPGVVYVLRELDPA